MDTRGFRSAFVEERFQRVAGATRLRQQQRVFHHLGNRCPSLSGQRMMRRSDHDQHIAMDGHRRQPLVRHRHGNDSEVTRVLDDRLQVSCCAPVASR